MIPPIINGFRSLSPDLLPPSCSGKSPPQERNLEDTQPQFSATLGPPLVREAYSMGRGWGCSCVPAGRATQRSSFRPLPDTQNWVVVRQPPDTKATSPMSSKVHWKMVSVWHVPSAVMATRPPATISSWFRSHRTGPSGTASSTQKMAVSPVRTAVFRGSFLVKFPTVGRLPR